MKFEVPTGRKAIRECDFCHQSIVAHEVREHRSGEARMGWRFVFHRTQGCKGTCVGSEGRIERSQRIFENFTGDRRHADDGCYGEHAGCEPCIAVLARRNEQLDFDDERTDPGMVRWLNATGEHPLITG